METTVKYDIEYLMESGLWHSCDLQEDGLDFELAKKLSIYLSKKPVGRYDNKLREHRVIRITKIRQVVFGCRGWI